MTSQGAASRGAWPGAWPGRGNRFARLMLAWIGVGHLITGLVALIADDRAIQVGSLLYGADFQPAEQFRYIIRPLGVYILAVAFLQLMAVRDPWRYRLVIDATLAIFFARLIQRLLFAGDIVRLFGMTPDDHWRRSAYFLLLALLLLLARLRLRPDEPAPLGETAPGGAAPGGAAPGGVERPAPD